MTAWEIVLWLLVILVGAACLASLLVLVALYRGLRDERDEMYVRSRMAAAMDRPMPQQSFRFRVVEDDGRDDDGPADDAWIARAVHPQQRPQPYYDGGRLTDGGA